ncbi:hypothetical protein ACH5RR_013845 [Cinchona calisaya]|uniref:DUF4378 domain-containing protein n=1 Tax=Cinchona calisaya TaxID=153742 RepID=A0ABD3A2M5_9GENT
MSEISGQTSLVIVEKRPQRPGGCVGIFFQLFDWNRRFAKKKLFSKKLLPPVRLRKSSKKFGGDEKLPKLRLIADENSGGFPHVKKNEGGCNGDTEQKIELRPPGLVARLMGLESMPAVQQDKSKKALLSGTGSKKGEKFSQDHGRFEREVLNAEKGEMKQELQPQKLQKTGLSEKKPVTRFGAEALQLKNVLSRSRKHHQKLVSPVKSPRNVSARNASRLIGAATRILEPGLQKNRSKCALTYPDAVHHPRTADAYLEEATDLEPLENSNCFQSSVKPLTEKSPSCRNCGCLLDISDVRPDTKEQPRIFSPATQVVNPPCKVLERGSEIPPTFCPQMEKGKNEEGSQLYAGFAVEDRQPCAGYMPDIKLLRRADQRHWQATNLCEIQKDVAPACLRHKTRRQNQMFQVRNGLLSSPKFNKLHSNRVSAAANATNETKEFVLLKRNLGDHSRLRMPLKEDTYHLDTDRIIGNRGHDSLSPVRKRRSVNSSRQNEGSSFVSSPFAKPTNTRLGEISGKDRCSTSHSTIGLCTNSRIANVQGTINADSGKNDSNVISFAFKSPMKHKTGIRADMQGRRNQNGPNTEASVLNENEGKRNSLRSLPLSGDSLGALLEQKLKELTCQEEDSAFGNATPKKTTAVILQELISALTAERPCHQDELAYRVHNRESHLCSDKQQYKKHISVTFQAKPKSTRISNGILPSCEHLSPGSVLDSSFSNDSCTSSSLDDGSRCNLGVESTECCEGLHQLDSEPDLLDSACSLSMGKFYRESVNNLLNNISEFFSAINLADVHLKGSKLTHAKEIILNTELVFGYAALPGAVVNRGFSISHFVINELEMLASVMWTSFSSFAAFDTKDGNQLKGFLFDCVIEYLETRFTRYSNSGFCAWTRLPLHMKTEMLICGIVEEVGRWAELAGLFPDELIEYEMSNSLGKWIDFEVEAFETGIEIDQQILQNLITEAVADFTGCKAICG